VEAGVTCLAELVSAVLLAGDRAQIGSVNGPGSRRRLAARSGTG